MDNVISLNSGRSYKQELIEEKLLDEEIERVKREAKSEAEVKHRQQMIEALENTKKLVEEGRLKGLVLLARDSEPDEEGERTFLTEVNLDSAVITRNDIFAWLGCLSTLEYELRESALMARHMTRDGKIADPFDTVDEIIDELAEAGAFDE